MPFKRVDADDIQYFRSIMPTECVIVGDAVNEDYAHDEMMEYGSFLPEAVLLPRSTEEVSGIMRYCHDKGIAVTPRGAGTGLCGGCVALHGGVVLSLQGMTKLLQVDKINMTATVEPGLLLMEFNALLEDTGLLYPPDPGEKSATVCGNIMTNAGGMRAVRYGVTKDYVLGMEVVLANGTVLELGGKVVKSSSGYNLMQLLCGSEGTLCILTKATVKLIPKPEANVSLLVPFDSLDKCVSCVPDVLSCGCEPTAVEFMEKEVIVAAESYLGKQFPDKSANAYLLVRLDGADDAALESRMQTVSRLLLERGAQDVLLADTDERKMGIWDARGAFLEAIKNSTPSMDECDVVVPREHIAEFVRQSRGVSRDVGVRIRSFGHAGDGNLHLYVCKDELDNEMWENRRAQAMNNLYALAKTMGGHVSGEHGIGHAKVAFLKESVGLEQIALMQGIKSVFDSMGILNPGKVVQ